MLVLEVEFLGGVYHAASHHHRGRAEWPPHPGRLFSALVATAYETGMGEEGLAALRWLEAAGEPTLWASEASDRSPYTSYVPVNALGPVGNEMTRMNRQPRQFPAVIPTSPLVWMVWPEPPEVHRAVLVEMVGRLSRLGNARSLIRAIVRRELPTDCHHTHHRWVPDKTGTELLRVPYPGRLAELDEAHALSQGRRHVQRAPLGKVVAYACDPKVDSPVPRSAWGEWVVYRQEGSLLPLEATLRLTQAVRATLVVAAEPDLVPWLLGRGNHPHIALVPLPFVGSEHSTGMIMGLAVLFPPQVPEPVRLQLYRQLARLHEVPLPGVGKVPLRREPPAGLSDLPRALQPGTWTRRAMTWQSVTPVILDRFPKGGEADAVAQIKLACERSGLPAPVEVSFTRTGTFLGVPPVRSFVLQQREGEAPRPAYHVRLRFEQPVQGPVLLGAGRFLGLGLCRPSFEGRRGDG
jgi:CRISPR-associated protein Csb2